LIRCLIDKDHAMVDKPLDCCGAVIGKRADNLPVVISVIWKSIWLHNRPICWVAEDQTRRIFDSILFWRLVPRPRGTLPPLVIAWPPICCSALITITEEPASRATIAAGSPAAPEPITIISASRSHDFASVAVCAVAGVRVSTIFAATAPAPLLPDIKTSRRVRPIKPPPNG